MPSRKIKRSIITPSAAALPTSDEIASRAHELFVADGRRLSAHWERGEQELLDRAFKASLGNNAGWSHAALMLVAPIPYLW